MLLLLDYAVMLRQAPEPELVSVDEAMALLCGVNVSAPPSRLRLTTP
jgi:hypothetical protein